MKHGTLLKSALFTAVALFATASDAQEVKNPLSQVAEYNLKADGTFETGDPETAYGDYFFWEDAMTAAMPKGHHLPSKSEALVIFGAMQTIDEEEVHPFPRFNWNYESEGDEQVTIWGEEATYFSYYRCNGDNVCYALRYIGGDNKYLSAYRWEVLLDGNQVDGMFGPEMTFSAIEITCRLIGPDGIDMTINDIANESYWETPSDNDVIRYIPAAGYQLDEYVDDIEDDEVRGRYWTSSVWENPEGPEGAYGFGMDAGWAFIYSWGKYNGYSVRPFMDADYEPGNDEPGNDEPANHDLNALLYVADYNTNADGSFATGDITEAFGDKFTNADIYSIDIPKGYHIPSKAELMTISGEYTTDIQPQPGYPDFGWKMDRGADEEVQLFGETLTLHSDYFGFGKDVCYAIRFQGGDNKYLSAYRWRPLLTGGQDDDFYKYMSALEVTCRVLGPAGADMKPSDIANDTFWDNNNENDVVKYFPAAGFGDYDSTSEDDDCIEENKRGRYWSKTQRDGSSGFYTLGFDSEMCYVIGYVASSRFSLRLFLDDETVSGIEENTCDSRKANFFYDGSSILAADRMIYDIEVYNMSGMKIFASHEDASRYFVNLENGLYVIKYKTSSEGKYQTMKMVVK